jgi:hypothetical protein
MLPANELRDFFKMFPRVENDKAFKGRFRKFVDTFKDQEKNCAGKRSWVYYQPLDGLNRATGVTACLREDAIKRTGRGAAASSKDTDIVGSDTVRDGRFDPPGYAAGRGLARGHLLARDLGGSGKELRNLVPQYINPNSGAQKVFEQRVANAVKGGEKVYYMAIPSYEGSDLIPYQITLYAAGNRGTKMSKIIPNTKNGRWS